MEDEWVKKMWYINSREYYSAFKRKISCWALVVHACNPSYSGVRDQEDHSLRPA
jgi:hypothetical protein